MRVRFEDLPDARVKCCQFVGDSCGACGRGVQNGALRGRRRAASSARASRRLSLFRLRVEFSEELFDRPAFPGTLLVRALLDGSFDLWVPEFQVVFKLIGAHNAGNRDAVFLQDEVLLVTDDPANDLAEVDAGFGEGKMMDHSCQFTPLMNND